MAQKPNKLLLTLTALGIAAGVNVTEAKAETATYGSFREFFSYTSASLSRDLDARLDFVRAYADSPAARRMAATIARELSRMSPPEQRAAMDAIAAKGGLPANVVAAANIAGLGTASVGRPDARPRGLDVARANTPNVAGASIY
jgi:hypothetical protein